MKLLLTITGLLAGLAASAPHDLEKRQINSNDIAYGNCAGIALAFVWARGSTEQGNMGTTLGPPVCTQLKQRYPGRVACQGVGGAYTAGLIPNEEPLGTTAAAISAATGVFQQASSKCSGATIVAGGYSQGSAVIQNSITGLSAAIKAKIAGVVLFGYTRNFETRGTIPSFDSSKVLVICRADDGVCGASLIVTVGHLAYTTDGSIGRAVNFLVSKINI